MQKKTIQTRKGRLGEIKEEKVQVKKKMDIFPMACYNPVDCSLSPATLYYCGYSYQAFHVCIYAVYSTNCG